MRIRSLLVPVVALALSASAAMAQQGPPGGGGPGGGGPGRRMQMMMQGITLTAAQQAQVDSIVARYQAQMPAFTPGTPPDSAAMATRRALTERRDAEIRAVLTPEQQPVFDRNLETMRANMPRRP